jgi:potassium voltage-gated channel Eag-related subfamily H protein 7
MFDSPATNYALSCVFDVVTSDQFLEAKRLKLIEISRNNDSLNAEEEAKRESAKQKQCEEESWLQKQKKNMSSQMATITSPRQGAEKNKVFHPNSKCIRIWDTFICTALIFTALVTPFEIAMLDTKLNLLFGLNRIFDCVFLCDVYVSIQLAFFDRDKGNWVMDPRKCAVKYLKGWFLMDIVSLIPWDVIAFVMEKGGSGGDMGKVRVLRLLKILKITKLARIVKAAKIFKQIATHFMMSSTTKQLIKYLFMIILCTHWIACGWSFLPKSIDVPVLIDAVDAVNHTDTVFRILKGNSASSGSTESKPYDSGENFCTRNAAEECISWIKRFEEQTTHEPLSNLDVYALSLEYSLSIMCMGYGTITPLTSTERWYSIFCLLFAGSLYAYVVGGICAAVASEDPAVSQYKENMDMLMVFLEHNKMPDALRIRAYEYFEFCRTLLQHKCHVQVLEHMAPSLRAEIASRIHGKWISSVPFLNPEVKHERSSLVMSICVALEPEAFPPNELLYMRGERCSAMYIVQRGLLAKSGGGNGARVSVLNHPSFFGEESLCLFLRNQGQQRRTTVKALSYVNSAKLETESLMEIIAARPSLFKETRRLVIRYATGLLMQECMQDIGAEVIRLAGKRGQKGVRERRRELIAIGRVKSEVARQMMQANPHTSERPKKEEQFTVTHDQLGHLRELVSRAGCDLDHLKLARRIKDEDASQAGAPVSVYLIRTPAASGRRQLEGQLIEDPK